jgi:hypothetical protein
MKVKVNLFDNYLRKQYLEVLTTISLLLSFALIAFDIPDEHKLLAGIILAIVLIITYVVIWLFANKMVSKTLCINNSTLVVKLGDIFEEKEFKVIAFNEYFDTIVDDKIISSRTLNGKYLQTKVSDISELDRRIESDQAVSNNLIEIEATRIRGKNKRYRLGSIFLNDDFILTAFTKFDSDNRAYLRMNDYMDFLLNFWNEVDKIYAGRSVSIPLLGSGITRFKEFIAISEQELLEMLIWSFKISRIKFSYPSKVTIVIHESMKDKINFYKLNGE